MELYFLLDFSLINLKLKSLSCLSEHEISKGDHLAIDAVNNDGGSPHKSTSESHKTGKEMLYNGEIERIKQKMVNCQSFQITKRLNLIISNQVVMPSLVLNKRTNVNLVSKPKLFVFAYYGQVFAAIPCIWGRFLKPYSWKIYVFCLWRCSNYWIIVCRWVRNGRKNFRKKRCGYTWRKRLNKTKGCKDSCFWWTAESRDAWRSDWTCGRDSADLHLGFHIFPLLLLWQCSFPQPSAPPTFFHQTQYHLQTYPRLEQPKELLQHHALRRIPKMHSLSASYVYQITEGPRKFY